MYTIDTGGSGFDTILSVRDGCTGAELANGMFVIAGVPVSAGPNQLTATATVLSGTIPVLASGTPDLLTLTAEPANGMAPLAVSFQYVLGSEHTLQQLSMDFDGDGTTDLVSTDAQVVLKHTYSAPGLYVAQLSATDSQGGPHRASVVVEVVNAASLDALLIAMWDGMNTALTAGDTTTAL